MEGGASRPYRKLWRYEALASVVGPGFDTGRSTKAVNITVTVAWHPEEDVT